MLKDFNGKKTTPNELAKTTLRIAINFAQARNELEHLEGIATEREWKLIEDQVEKIHRRIMKKYLQERK